LGEGLELKLEGTQARQKDVNNILFFYFSYTIMQWSNEKQVSLSANEGLASPGYFQIRHRGEPEPKEVMNADQPNSHLCCM
jgi:hypothetical protein